MDLMTEITIFVLAAFVGFEVISKVPTTLHTPLMSQTNAIHGIVMLGGLIVIGSADDSLEKVIGVIAIAFSRVSSAEPMTISPPSMTMPWIALVWDISGVCRVVGTFEMTSKPTKAARTKIVISVIRLMRRLPPWLSR